LVLPSGGFLDGQREFMTMAAQSAAGLAGWNDDATALE